MTTETNYENMFKAAVMDLAEVSVALNLPDQVTLTANGNAEILAAIRRKDARIAELERVAGAALGALNAGIPISPRSMIHDDLKSLMGRSSDA